MSMGIIVLDCYVYFNNNNNPRRKKTHMSQRQSFSQFVISLRVLWSCNHQRKNQCHGIRLDQIRLDQIDNFLSQCNAREIRDAFPGESEQPYYGATHFFCIPPAVRPTLLRQMDMGSLAYPFFDISLWEANGFYQQDEEKLQKTAKGNIVVCGDAVWCNMNQAYLSINMFYEYLFFSNMMPHESSILIHKHVSWISFLLKYDAIWI